MFDIGFWELSIIGVVALVIVGPERLPGLARTAGLWVGKGRRMLSDVKRDIDREIKTSEMADLNALKKDFEDAGKEVQKAGETIKSESGVDDLKNTFKDASPLKDDLKSEIDEIDQVSKEFDAELSDKSQNTRGSQANEGTPDQVHEQITKTSDVDSSTAVEEINHPEKGAV